VPRVYLGLGSNLGDRERNIHEAIRRLSTQNTKVLRQSGLYATEPLGDTPEAVPDYINAVLLMHTDLSPETLLDLTRSVEVGMGRGASFRWGPRIIDIDILLYGDVTVQSERLRIPHPRMRERAFVLEPLADIAPDLLLPGGESVAELLNDPSIRAQKIERLGATQL
jgi:2-amino-4-hydroxy-6-hydroxymethyldihydropteridine diphosphokinase